MNEIWTEKYRPKTFTEVIGQTHIVNQLQAFVKQKNMPHLLFSGPAGVGKTTISLIIAKETFGEDWRNNFLELNASDERGIDVVRNKVKDFARTRTIGDYPFKIIYLDECDALTKEAQQALRRTMENYTKTCRFVLSCNYSSKIIDPIQSRCAVFRFRPVSKEEVFNLVDFIAKGEELVISDGAKKALYEVSEGDCRKVTNILQSCASTTRNIEETNIYAISAVARPTEILDILNLATKNKFVESRDKLLKTMYDYGLSGLDVIKQIQKEILNLDIDSKKKMMLIDKCGDIEFRLVEGSDEYLQLESFLAYIAYATS